MPIYGIWYGTVGTGCDFSHHLVRITYSDLT